MAPSTTASWWEYSRWVWSIGRNMRITEPIGAELTAVQTFVTTFYNPATNTGSRPWLKDEFFKKSASVLPLAPSAEPASNLVEMLQVVGRDLRKIPITSAEEALADTLFTDTGNRRLGTGPFFGGVGGALLS